MFERLARAREMVGRCLAAVRVGRVHGAPLLIGTFVVGALLTGGCKGSEAKQDDEAASGAAVDREAKAVPFQVDLLPIDALESLAAASTPAEGSCAAPIAALHPLQEALLEHVKSLRSSLDAPSAGKALRSTSRSIADTLQALPTANGSDEERRLSAELEASLRDLKDSLVLLATALPGKAQAAKSASYRIQNAVDNTLRSVETLAEQCSP